MNRLTGFIVLGVGIALFIWGLNENGSLGGSISRAFSGSPTNKAMALMVGGGVLTAVGAYMSFFSKKKK